MTWAYRIAGIGGLLMMAAAIPSRAASRYPEPTIRVRLYNYAQVPPATLSRAKAAASDILERAGVRLDWTECRLHGDDPPKDPGCDLAATPIDLQLRVLDTVMARRAGMSRHSLGYALLADGFYSIAAVYFHRAIELEKEGLILRSTILGGMMAHEIGHLLLEESRHSKDGIMRAAWGDEELKMLARGRMSFTATQTARLASTVARRDAWGN